MKNNFTFHNFIHERPWFLRNIFLKIFYSTSWKYEVLAKRKLSICLSIFLVLVCLYFSSQIISIFRLRLSLFLVSVHLLGSVYLYLSSLFISIFLGSVYLYFPSLFISISRLCFSLFFSSLFISISRLCLSLWTGIGYLVVHALIQNLVGNNFQGPELSIIISILV